MYVAINYRGLDVEGTVLRETDPSTPTGWYVDEYTVTAGAEVEDISDMLTQDSKDRITAELIREAQEG